VKEDALHEMYAEFWTIHWMYQKVKAGFQKKYGG
jgi:hypothetical protein